jgi:hypothetical protein
LEAANKQLTALQAAQDKTPAVRVALRQFKAAQRTLDRARENAARAAAPKVLAVRNTITMWEQRLKAARAPINPTDKVLEFFREITRGVDYGAHYSRWRVRWCHPTGRYCVFTIPGSSIWAGIGAPRSYAPAQHYLVDVEKSVTDAALRLDRHALAKREGRLTAGELREMLLHSGFTV